MPAYHIASKNTDIKFLEKLKPGFLYFFVYEMTTDICESQKHYNITMTIGTTSN